MSELAGRHAVVTGGSAGIGRAVFHALARAGARVTIMARDVVRARDEAARVPNAGAVQLDVTDGEGAAARAFESAVAERGAVDILVNNAGGAESAPFAKTDAALWQRMLALNLSSTFFCTRAVFADMRARGGGRIINIASSAGLKGYAYTTAYSAAKHGVVGLTRALALEAATSGVTVNALCPGFCDTPMLRAAAARVASASGRSVDEARAEFVKHNPQGRLITPEEVAGAALWLCSDAARGVNGHALALAGGEVF